MNGAPRGRIPGLLVVSLAAQDLAGAVELFEEDQPGQTVGKGHGGKGNSHALARARKLGNPSEGSWREDQRVFLVIGRIS